jgi:glutamyl-tRNA reductase
MIVVVGFSHHTAPIAVREQFALDETREDSLISGLLASGKVSEAFAVSTCNRVELYVTAPSAEPELIAESVATCRGLFVDHAPALASHLYDKSGSEALRHLFRVASSLDSLVIGEAQILGQLKQGYERGLARKSVGRELGRIFPHALRSAKRVRTETEIGAGQVSVPTVAVGLAERIFGDLKGHRVVVIGAGEMGQTLGRLFHELGANLTLVGRSEERAESLLKELGAPFCHIDQLSELLATSDIVVSSTAASEPILSAQTLAGLKRVRRGRNLFLIDLAVPRDIEPSAGELEGVFLYNIDDLSVIAHESRVVREREAERAEQIVDEMLGELERRRTEAQVTPTIVALRERVRDAFGSELDKSLRGKLSGLGAPEQAAVTKLIEAGINRLLHTPSTRLREEAGRGAEGEALEWSRALSELFALDAGAEAGSPRAVPPEPGVSEVPAADETAPARAPLDPPIKALEGRARESESEPPVSSHRAQREA